jgi:hypothetical protein
MDTDTDNTASVDSSEQSDDDFEALTNPPADHKLLTYQYPTLLDLEDDFHDFAATAGFAVYTKRSSNKVKNQGYTRIDYGCALGALRPSE